MPLIQIPECAAVTFTSSSYTPGSINTQSPLVASLTAAWIVVK